MPGTAGPVEVPALEPEKRNAVRLLARIRLTAVACGAALLTAQSAVAATVTGQPGRVDIAGGVGEQNVVTLSHVGSTLIVVDVGAPLTVGGTGCTKSGEHEVRCDLPFPEDGPWPARVDADLDDGPDQLTVDASLEHRALMARLSGGAGDDVLTTRAAGADLLGGSGDDLLIGTDRELCRGSVCAPTDLYGDHLDGGAGADMIQGRGGRDSLDGDDGNDLMDAGTGADIVEGGSGDDVLVGDVLTDPVPVDFSDPYGALAEADQLEGGDGNDVLSAGTGQDDLSGGAGDDRLDGGTDGDKLRPGTGTDRVAGGDAADRVTYDDRNDGLALSLDGVANDGAAGEFDNLLEDVESVAGGAGPDRLIGTARSETLWGGGGNDILSGLGGNDQLVGAAGDDIIDVVDELSVPIWLLTPETGGAFDDYVACGTGNDSARIDTADNVAEFAMPVGVDRCESVERVPAIIRVRNGTAPMRFACACRVAVAIRARGRLLARGSGRQRVRVRLTRAGRVRLRRSMRAILSLQIAGDVDRRRVRLVRAGG